MRQQKREASLIKESIECTFQPNMQPGDQFTTKPKKATKQDAKSFWERNVNFLDKKQKKTAQLDQYFYQDSRFTPQLCEKSRKLSQQARDGNKSITSRSRPWLDTDRSRSREAAHLNSILSSTVLTNRVPSSFGTNS